MARSVLAFSTVALAVADLNSKTVRLNNGIEMPKLAFAAEVWPDSTCHDATLHALQAGFRNVWSSVLVGLGCQAAQSKAIQSSNIPRSEIFIAGTVNTAMCSGLQACYEKTMSDAEVQFTTLGVDTLDMIMLDYPAYSGCDSITGQWKAFEELYARERVRTIAVSNFSPDQIACITANASATIPSVNQLHYSVGKPGTMIADNEKYGIIVQSYSPLDNGALIHNKDCEAIGKKHGKTAAQIALKWILQTTGTVATQSTKLAHLLEDLSIFDFTLTAEEMATLSSTSPWVVV